MLEEQLLMKFNRHRRRNNSFLINSLTSRWIYAALPRQGELTGALTEVRTGLTLDHRPDQASSEEEAMTEYREVRTTTYGVDPFRHNRVGR